MLYLKLIKYIDLGFTKYCIIILTHHSVDITSLIGVFIFLSEILTFLNLPFLRNKLVTLK